MLGTEERESQLDARVGESKRKLKRRAYFNEHVASSVLSNEHLGREREYRVSASEKEDASLQERERKMSLTVSIEPGVVLDRSWDLPSESTNPSDET